MAELLFCRTFKVIITILESSCFKFSYVSYTYITNLSEHAGTSMLIGQVGAVKLADFAYTKGGVLTSWPNFLKFGIVGFTANGEAVCLYYYMRHVMQ